MNRGYFADMKEFKEHGGKVIIMSDSFFLCYYLAVHDLVDDVA